MSILSSISQKFGQYFGGQSSQESTADSSQNQKSSLNETLRQASQQLHELVHQGSNNEYWNTAITGKIGGPCDIAQADNLQSTEPLSNDLLTGVNTLSGAAAFAVNAVSNTVCGVVFDFPEAVEEKIVGMGGPSFDELFVTAQMTPGPPVDDALAYGLNRLAEIGGELRIVKGSQSVSRLSQEFFPLTSEPSIKLKYDPINKIWTSPAGAEYGMVGKNGNRIQHVLEHLEANTDKRLHTVFKHKHAKEILPLIDEAWVKRGVALPKQNPLAYDVYLVEMDKVVGSLGETKLRIVTMPNSARIITAYPVE